MRIRQEHAGDAAAVQAVNQTAFGGHEEASLVAALHNDGAVLLSLVAEFEGAIVGHILFSRMHVDNETAAIPAAALAPLAVAPEWQRRGIGGVLTRAGLDLLHQAGEKLVIVVGHAAYYPRFGFSTEFAAGLDHPFPRESFMALSLDQGSAARPRGRVRYARAFGL